MFENKVTLQYRKILFIIIGLFCCTPIVDAPEALFIGFVFSMLLGHPFMKHNGKLTKFLLQYSIIGLGFGMNIIEAAKAGKQGLLFTIVSIATTLILGYFLGKWLRVPQKTSTLISSGTAICGGSAIAAVAPVIDSDDNETSVALASIFILNSLALFIFPLVGHWLEMSQADFGLWSAIAIHDTSSVVGAAQKYGNEALKIATTIKLERALWIIPLSLGYAFLGRQQQKTRDKNLPKPKIKIPYFIFGFVVAMLINTFVPAMTEFNQLIVILSKRGLTLTLFLIGAGLSLKALKTVGIKPLLQAVLLWLFISISALYVILSR